MDGLKSLANDHDKVMHKMTEFRHLLDEVEKGKPLGEAMASLREAVILWQTEISLHFRKEEDALFPLMEEAMGGDLGPIPSLKNHHKIAEDAINALAKEIAKDTPDEDKVLDHARVFADTLYHHAAAEESVLLPLARKVLSPDKLEQFNERFATVH